MQAPPSPAPCWAIYTMAHVEVLHAISARQAGPCVATPRPHNLQRPNEQKDSKAQSLLTAVSEALRTSLTKRRQHPELPKPLVVSSQGTSDAWLLLVLQQYPLASLMFQLPPRCQENCPSLSALPPWHAAVPQGEPGDVRAPQRHGEAEPLSSVSSSASLKLFIMIFAWF